jgi:hypothetical protein
LCANLGNDKRLKTIEHFDLLLELQMMSDESGLDVMG